MTSNLIKRVQEHKDGVIDGFTKRYHIKKLVYYDSTDDVQVAIQREKQLKKRKRERKIELIESVNSERNDLANDL
jgi:putative endonuclease